MRNIIRGLAIIASLIGSPAFSQTSANFTYGQVPTVQQWNDLFSSKQDYLGAPSLPISGGTLTGRLITAPSTSGIAGLNIPPGTAPTVPTNGDLWTTSAGIFVRVNGSTVGPLGSGGGGGSITLSSGTSFGITAPGTMTLGGSYAIGNVTDQLHISGLGIGTTSPSSVLEAVDVTNIFPRGITSTNYNTAAAGAIFVGRHARGSAVSPGTTLANDFLVAIGGQGFGATGWSSNIRGGFAVLAAENWSDVAQGTSAAIYTTPTGSTTLTPRMTVSATGDVNVSSVTAVSGYSTGALTVAGGVGISGALDVQGIIFTGTSVNVQSAVTSNGFILSNASNSVAYVRGIGTGNDNGQLALFNAGSATVVIQASGTSSIGGGGLNVSGTVAATNYTGAWGGSTITPAFGGTGLATLTTHGVMLGEGTGNVAFATVGIGGRVLIDQGGSADPAFTAISGALTLTSGGVAALASTAVTPGTYGSATQVGQFTVAADGRITAASNVGISGGGGGTTPGGSSGQVQFNSSGSFAGFTVGGDATLNTGTGALTVTKTSGTAFGALATLGAGTGLSSSAGNLIITNTVTGAGPIGSTTVTPVITFNSQGQLTTVTSATIAPAWSSITGTPTTLAGYGITSPLPVAQGGTATATAFTAGSVVFAGASGVYSQNNSQLFWDNSNDFLGVRTAVPASAVEVFDATTAFPRGILVTSSNAVATGPVLGGRHSRGTQGSPTASLVDDVLMSFGGVGYGASAWGATLRGSVKVNAGENWSNTAQGTYLRFENTPLGGTATAEHMRLDPAGNLLIGTTTALTRLTVSYSDTAFVSGLTVNNTATTGNAWAGIDIVSGSNTKFLVAQQPDGTAVLDAVGTNNMTFNTNNINRGAFLSTGELDLKSTTISTSTTTGAVRIAGGLGVVSGGNFGASVVSLSASTGVGYFVNNGSNGVAALTGSSGSNDNGNLTLANGGVTGVSLSAASTSYIIGGNIGIGTTSPNVLLDIKTATNHHVGFRDLTLGTQIFGVNDGDSSYEPLYIDATSLLINTSSAGTLTIGGTTITNGPLGIGGSPIYGFDDFGNARIKYVSAPQLTIDNTTANTQSAILFADNGTNKWEIGKDTSQAFFIFDNVRSASVFTAASNGDAEIMGGGGFLGVGRTPTRPLDIQVATTASVGGGTVRAIGYQASFEVFNQAGTSDYYFGVNDAASNQLYIGRGYGPNQGIAPAITVTGSDDVTIGVGSLFWKWAQGSSTTAIFSTPTFNASDSLASNNLTSSYNLAQNKLGATLFVGWTGTGNTGFGAPQGTSNALIVSAQKANYATTTVLGETNGVWINAFGGLSGESSYSGNGDVSAIEGEVRQYGSFGYGAYVEYVSSYYNGATRTYGGRGQLGVVDASGTATGLFHVAGLVLINEVGGATQTGPGIYVSNNGGTWSYAVLTSAGGYLNMAGVAGNTSDPVLKNTRRLLKTTLSDAGFTGMDVVNGIDPVTFRWNDLGLSQKLQYGFLASDDPDDRSIHGVREFFAERNLEFGGHNTNQKGIQTLEKDQMYPAMWLAVQELDKRVKSLETVH